jgi:ribosomal protein S17E
MKRIASSKEHDELVREIEQEILSLDLLIMSRRGVFSKGFLPDVVTNVGGSNSDWVIIDVINTPDSLKRDIAGLLTIKTNAEKKGYSVRGILGVCGNRIRTIENYIALIEQYPNFFMVLPQDVKDYLKMMMFESAKEKLNRLGYITSLLHILKRTNA